MFFVYICTGINGPDMCFSLGFFGAVSGLGRVRLMVLLLKRRRTVTTSHP